MLSTAVVNQITDACIVFWYARAPSTFAAYRVYPRGMLGFLRGVGAALGCLGALSLVPSDGAALRGDAVMLRWMASERATAAADAVHQPRAADGIVSLGDAHRATFVDGAARIGSVAIGLSSLGRDGAMRDVHGAEPAMVGPEVRIERAPGVTEWWRSLAIGLEQGITMAERPAGEGDLSLVMDVGLGVAVELEGPRSARLVDAATRAPLAHYAQPAAIDADGRSVPVAIARIGERLALRVDDRGARYPLVVDPLVRLTTQSLPYGPDDFLDFGEAVAIAANGARIAVGSPRGDGGVDIFEPMGTTWVAEHHEPGLGSDGDLVDRHYGASVAVDGTGTRILVGSTFYASETRAVGRVTVLVRSGSAWSEEDELQGSLGTDIGYFGWSADIDAAGRRAVIGAPNERELGAAYVFLRGDADDWVEEARLVAADGENVGESVAISADGARIAVATDDAAVVYLRSGTTWTEEAVIAHRGGVALSGDATRLLIAESPSRVFVRDGSTWTEEGVLSAPSGASGFGSAADISDDGLRAFVAAPFQSPGGAVHVFVRRGSAWTYDVAAPVGAAPPASARLGTSLELASGGIALAVGMPGAGNGRASYIAWELPDGEPCSDAASCGSGFCVDGVCCESACGGSITDCQACSAALNGIGDGACAPLSDEVAPTVVCRAAAGLCDAPEACVAGDAACPGDEVSADGTTCGGMVPGSCGTASECDGVSVACPSPSPLPSGTVCRAAVGTCDAEEQCDGSSVACPGDLLHGSSTTCRPSAGVCDVADTCDGLSSDCPSDRYQTRGVVCGGTAGTCALAGNSCPGDGPDCSSSGGVRPMDDVCLPAAAGSECDVPDRCDGVTATCAPAFAEATEPCGTDSGEVCDAPDHCAGTTALCVATYLAGTECRPAAGGCDEAELCTGADALCPPDAVSSAGTTCRPAVDPVCDEPEACDGVAASCPADETTCDAGVRPDAGRDTGGTDAGTPPPPAASCACRAERARGGLGWLSLVLLAVLAIRRR